MPEPLSPGDPDGHGRYGMLEELPEGLDCHLCGRPFPNLGVHAYRGHGITAAQNREQHDLQRRAGLVSSGLRGRIQQNARSRMSTPAGQAFVAARDPKRAEAARLGRSIRWRPAARATFRAARVGAGRLGTEVVCANTDCGAVFCPLNQAKRRRFCTRSCASRYARATARRDLTPRPSED